jgi:hypothetical protein
MEDGSLAAVQASAEEGSADAHGVDAVAAGGAVHGFRYLEEPPARLTASPWRDKLERAAQSRRFSVHWWRRDVGDWIGLGVEVRNRELVVVKRGGLTKLASHFDEGAVAERVAEGIMDPHPG